MSNTVIDTRTGKEIPKSKAQEPLPGENQPAVDLSSLKQALPKIIKESPYLKSIRGE